MSLLGIGIYSIVVRANSERPFFQSSILESLFLIFLVSLLLYTALHVYFFLVILELYLDIKANEPAPVVEEPEVLVIKEEELQLIESPTQTADETDKGVEEKTDAEKLKEEEAKEDAKCSKIRCPTLPKCPSLKCPSWGNCVGPDNFQ